jgi:hypothetical protein
MTTFLGAAGVEAAAARAAARVGHDRARALPRRPPRVRPGVPF